MHRSVRPAAVVLQGDRTDELDELRPIILAHCVGGAERGIGTRSPALADCHSTPLVMATVCLRLGSELVPGHVRM